MTVSNQEIKIRNKGNQAKNGSFGDLIIKVIVYPHEKFTLQEYKDDKMIITSTENISLSQAILGDTITVQTYYGMQKLVIPSGTNHDDELIIEPPSSIRYKQIDSKISLDEYFRYSRNSSSSESLNSQSKSSNKNQPISVIKVKIDMPKSISDLQMKILHDYQQIENISR